MKSRYELYIIGASGLGREVLAWTHEIPTQCRDWDVRGFLDSRGDILRDYEVPIPIFGTPETFCFSENQRAICAVGDPSDRLYYCQRLLRNGAKFISLIHPTAMVSPRATVNEGCIIATNCMIGPDARIGAHTVALGSTAIGTGATVGEGTTISAFCSVGDGAILGREVFLGSHAVILPGTKIGDRARIGARSVVSGNVENATTLFGVPAELIWKK